MSVAIAEERIYEQRRAGRRGAHDRPAVVTSFWFSMIIRYSVPRAPQRAVPPQDAARYARDDNITATSATGLPRASRGGSWSRSRSLDCYWFGSPPRKPAIFQPVASL